jgi:hypothetical protein
LTRLDVRDGRVNVGDDTGTAVAEHRVLVELGSHFRQRAHNARGLHRRGHLLKMRRVVPQLRHDATLVQAIGLGTAADQRIGGTNEDVVRLRQWIRHLLHNDVFETFSKHLLHACLP